MLLQGEVHFDDDSDTDNILGPGNNSISEDYSISGEAGGRGSMDHSSAHMVSSHWTPKEPLQVCLSSHELSACPASQQCAFLLAMLCQHSRAMLSFA